jgi:fructokinase
MAGDAAMILVSGEALIDLIPDPDVDNRYDGVLGGSPYNVAIGLGRLGADVAFLSRLSKDANGEALAAALAADRVDLSLAAYDPRPTPLAFVMRGTAQTGSRYSFYLGDTAYDGAWPFPAVWPAKASHLHLGSFSALDPRHADKALDALARAQGVLTTSFDPNVRPHVTPDRDAVLAVAEKHVRLASFVKASEEDLEWLYPGRPAEESLKVWAGLGPQFCIATLGEKGALAYVGSERLTVAPRKVAVVDTVGAGDSFTSALLFAMGRDGALGGGAPAATADRLAAWTDFAARASAITCGRKGSNPPTLADVEAATKA